MATDNPPPRKFCEGQISKVLTVLRTFGKSDDSSWRACATAVVNEDCARRYLASRSWMASRAVMAITKTIQWRLEFGLHRNGCGQSARKEACTKWSWEEQDRAIRLGTVRDKCGRPILIFSASTWPNEDEEWLHMVIYALEEATEWMNHAKTYPEKKHDQQREPQPDQQPAQQQNQRQEKNEHSQQQNHQEECSDEEGETWLWAIDMEGASLGDAPSLQVLRKLDDILFAHYPGRLRKVLLVNMPAFLKFSFSLTEMLLDESTRQKIVVVDEEDDKLEHFIDPANAGELFGPIKTTKKVPPPPPNRHRASANPPLVEFGGLFKCIA